MEKRTVNIVVRVTPEERERFTSALRKRGLEMSNEIRAFLERKLRRLERKDAGE